ncbi:hypothetical protein NN6n1_35560 [Shinella zoogloeoides]
MMVPNLTATGSGGSIPGPPGKSVELQTTETAIQWRQTGGEWQDLVLLADITGTNGDPGESVELRKTATAIQWRAGTDGVWADLVPLADLKGEPGDDFAVQYENGVVDLGPVRMAWGVADSILGTPEAFLFPTEFAAPPVVQITKQSRGGVLVPQAVSKTGFTINRGDQNPSPIPFQWYASGLKPDPSVVPSARFDVPGLPIWSAAVRAQRAGRRNARILCLGDSTTAGLGAYSTGMSANEKAGSYPTALCGLMTSRGSFASWSSLVGSQNAPNIAQYDTRCTFGAGWGLDYIVSNQTMGAFMFRSATANGKFNFAPLNQCDTFEFYSARRLTSGNAALITSINDIDKTSVSVVGDSTDPGYFVKTTVSAALGANVFNVRSSVTDNTQLHFAGIVGYNSAVKEVTVLNGGWSNAKVGDFNNGQTLATSPLRSIALYNPDLAIINLGINDWGIASPTPNVTWQSNMQAIIDTCIASGADVMLVVPNAIGGLYGPSFDARAGLVEEMAIRNGVRLLDIRNVLGSYTAANAAGDMRDVIHPNATGYSKIATAIADVIMPVGA